MPKYKRFVPAIYKYPSTCDFQLLKDDVSKMIFISSTIRYLGWNWEYLRLQMLLHAGLPPVMPCEMDVYGSYLFVPYSLLDYMNPH